MKDEVAEVDAYGEQGVELMALGCWRIAGSILQHRLRSKLVSKKSLQIYRVPTEGINMN